MLIPENGSFLCGKKVIPVNGKFIVRDLCVAELDYNNPLNVVFRI